MLTLVLLSLAHATTWTVDPSGSGDATTIAHGVALLEDGDTLSIAAGTYNVEDVLVEVNNVILQGAGWQHTIFDGAELDGHGGSDGLEVEGEDVVIEGIGFRNYRDVQSAMSIGGSAELWDCAFIDNDSGVIATYAGSANVSIFNTIFAMNIVGVYVPKAIDTLHIESSLFIDNSFIGFYLEKVDDESRFNRIEVVNSTFLRGMAGVDISGKSAYGVVPGDSEVLLVNNLFSGQSDYRWALGLDDEKGLTADIRNNVYSPLTYEYLASDGSTFTETDNLEAEPEFVANSDDGDWTNDDLHLVAGSPGIDAGADGYATSTTDLDGADRVIDGDGDGLSLPDAGAYEYCPPEICPELDTGSVDTASDTGDSADSAAEDSDSPTDTGSSSRKGRSIFGCTTTGAPPSSLALVLLALLGLRRRQR